MASTISFEWDENKNSINKEKHGISFEEAKTVFYDPNARVLADENHSSDEDRFLILGLSNLLRTLVVCHCYRKDNDVIRIISARKANAIENRQYNTLRGQP